MRIKYLFSRSSRFFNFFILERVLGIVSLAILISVNKLVYCGYVVVCSTIQSIFTQFSEFTPISFINFPKLWELRGRRIGLIRRNNNWKMDKRRHAVSVYVSVCLSRSCVVSKRINISIFFHRRIATPF